MADNFGLKIGVEGEREFKNALRDINQSFKVLGSEMKLVSSQFDKQDKSVQAITARNQVLNKEIDAQKNKISTLEKALANAASSFGENDKRTQAWQIQLNNAKAELNGMERELEQNNKALDEAAEGFDEAEKQTREFGDELDDTADTADDAGGKFEKLGAIVKGIGIAVGAAMAAIGAATAAAGKALYNMATDAAAAGDRIDKVSQSVGLSTKGFQEWDYVLSQNGADIESLKTGLNGLNNTVDDVINGNEAAARKFERLGISIDDLRGKSREEIFNMTIAGLQGVSDESEKAAIASDLLGKSAVGLAPLLNQTAESTEALKQKANELGMVMSDDAIAASVAFTDSLDTLKRTFGGIKNAIGAQLLPGLTMITDGFTGLLTGQEDAGQKLKEGAEEIVRNITELIPRVLGIVSSIVSALAQVAPDIIKALVVGIVDNLPTIIDAAVSIVQTLLGGVIDALPQLTQGALYLVLALLDGIIANLPALVEGALLIIVTLAEGIADALPELIPAIVEAIILIVEVLLNNMDKILDAAFRIIEGLAQGLLNALPRLIEALPRIISSIINFITNNLPKIIEMGISLIVQLAVGLIKAIPELIKALPQIIAAIITGLGKAVGSVFEIGKNIVTGLWNGIKSMITWIKDKISDFVGGIVSGVKGLLGIKSPSTVFAGIGDDMAQGIGVGFDKAMDKVAKDMQDAVPTSFDVNSSVDVNGSGGIAGFGNNPLVVVQQMIVRSEDDIRRISQELYNLMQTGSRAQGRFSPA
jgi:phage-related protein